MTDLLSKYFMYFMFPGGIPLKRFWHCAFCPCISDELTI